MNNEMNKGVSFAMISGEKQSEAAPFGRNQRRQGSDSKLNGAWPIPSKHH